MVQQDHQALMPQGGSTYVLHSALIQLIYVMLLPLAKRICTTYVDPKGFEAFVACRLISLCKCPGVRTIIGEVIPHIIGKAISIILKYDQFSSVLVMTVGVRLPYMLCISYSIFHISMQSSRWILPIP